MSDQPKTIDERIEALTMNLELLSRSTEEYRLEMRHLDERERKARRAIAVALQEGLAAYFRELDEDEDQEK